MKLKGKMSKSKTLGLALGGGGARGLAHIGFLQVIHEAGIEVSAICGASVGSIIGCGYALYHDPYLLEEVFETFLDSDAYRNAGFARIKMIVAEPGENDGFVDRVTLQLKRSIMRGKLLTRAGILDHEAFEKVIEYLVPDKAFEDAKLDFSCVALDLTEGRAAVMKEGRLRPAVLASAAAAGLVAPVQLNGRLMADGVWVYSVPVSPLKKTCCDVIIAVDVDQDILPKDDFGTIVDITLRAQEAAIAVIKDFQIELADLVVKPMVGQFHWSDFDQYEEVIQKGREAARQSLPRVKELLKRPWWPGMKLFLKQQ